MESKTYFLIENNAQVCFTFKSLKELRKFAKQHGWKIKKSTSDANGTTYYTESYEILPTGEID
jgi:fructose-specific phosphotransferase system component IIB